MCGCSGLHDLECESVLLGLHVANAPSVTVVQNKEKGWSHDPPERLLFHVTKMITMHSAVSPPVLWMCCCALAPLHDQDTYHDCSARLDSDWRPNSHH